MSTKTASRPYLWLLVAACILLTTACSTVSRVPTIKPTPPSVSCQQPVTPAPAPPPAADEWVQYVAPSTFWPAGVARLSEAAASWVIEVLASDGKERALREVEHACLDAYEKAGMIRQ